MDQLRGPVDRLSFNLYKAAVKLLNASASPDEQDQNFVVGVFAAATAAAYIYLGSNGTAKNNLLRVLHLKYLFENRVTPELIMIAFRQAVAHVTKKGDRHFPLDQVAQASGFQVRLTNKAFFRDGDIIHSTLHKNASKNLNMEVDDISSLLSKLNETESVEKIRRSVNDWVCHHTEGKIKEMLHPNLTDNTKNVLTSNMFLINVSSMRGNWHSAFPAAMTSVAPFYLTSGKTVLVPMMRFTAQVPYYEDEERQVQYIELPYIDNEASLCLLMPMQQSRLKLNTKKKTLADVEAKLATDTFLRYSMYKRMRDVIIQIPKFKVENSFDLKDLFGRVGMKPAFESSESPEMVENPRFHLSGAIHEASIELNEHGSVPENISEFESLKPSAEKAKANENQPRVPKVSSFSEAPDLAQTFFQNPRQSLTGMESFVADHPFMFAVRHNKSGLVLFVGRISSFGNNKDEKPMSTHHSAPQAKLRFSHSDYSAKLAELKERIVRRKASV